MEKLKIEYVDINSIKPYEKNAKLHPKEQIEQIKKSIEMFGMDDPIGVWKDEIVEGHGRLIALKELGYTEIPIIRLDHLTDEERRAYTLAHNKLTMNSDFDIDILNDELMNFDTIDMSEFGFDLTMNTEEYEIARTIYAVNPTDGKYILTDDKLIICQSNMKNEDLEAMFRGARPEVIINPLGEWTGGTNVDTGATNRKLGSDMAQSVTGGGLHGKDLSKADVSVNIYAFLKAQETGEVVNLCCAIGDEEVDGIPYEEIVEKARQYIKEIGGFEKFSEWGLY